MVDGSIRHQIPTLGYLLLSVYILQYQSSWWLYLLSTWKAIWMDPLLFFFSFFQMRYRMNPLRQSYTGLKSSLSISGKCQIIYFWLLHFVYREKGYSLHLNQIVPFTFQWLIFSVRLEANNSPLKHRSYNIRHAWKITIQTTKFCISS